MYVTGEPDFDDSKKTRYKLWREMYCPKHTKTSVCGNESPDKASTYQISKKSIKLKDPVILYSTGSVSMESLLKLPTPVKKTSKKPTPVHSSWVIKSSESIEMFKKK